MGTKIDVQTVQGEGKLKIPEGTQSGKSFKLRAKGAPRVNRAGNGDQYVKVVVKTPTNLTRKQRKFFRSLIHRFGLSSHTRNVTLLESGYK